MKETFGPSYTNLGWEKRGPGSPLMKAWYENEERYTFIVEPLLTLFAVCLTSSS
jgi:hypothetical protein